MLSRCGCKDERREKCNRSAENIADNHGRADKWMARVLRWPGKEQPANEYHQENPQGSDRRADNDAERNEGQQPRHPNLRLAHLVGHLAAHLASSFKPSRISVFTSAPSPALRTAAATAAAACGWP